MGDTAVDFFLDTLNQLITSSYLDVVMDKKDQLIQSLEKEIKYLRGFLKITEKKRYEHPEIMNLVMQIRDVVSEAENIVEQIMVFVLKADHDHLYIDLLFEGHHDIIFESDSLDLESVKEKIRTLADEVKQIHEENKYDLNGVVVKRFKDISTKSGGGGSSSSGGKNTSQVVEEKVVVGFKDEVKTLMGKLHDNGEGGQLEIISIIGAGGGGKTTLARQVYDHPFTSQKFEIRAWANVSQEYDNTRKRSLLLSILESASPEKPEDYETSSEDKLGEKVYKCLQGRKYLIVMDDIWDIEAWNDIQRSFPREYKGSKVLLTSRLTVQPNSINYAPHVLDLLSESCCWDLLQNKVFGKQQCPPELVDIGKKIAGKCKGLPLAVVAIAGILATKDKTLDVWEKVAEHLSSNIVTSSERCMEILELSYNHLPLHLKACFLYIGGHREDYEIPVRNLIWLWIAEGFIQQSEAGKSLEDVAEDYLKSLIDRNLIMVARKSKCLDEIEACRIHDLLRELCLKKAEEDNFLLQSYDAGSFLSFATNKHRRLFTDSGFYCKFPPGHRAQNLRSFLFLRSSNHPRPIKLDLSFFVENVELLRVLHLARVRTPGEIRIGDLVHLRYLALQVVAYEPIFLFHYLSNLETLDLLVPHNQIILLPRDIVKMVKLRHLNSFGGRFEYHYISHDEDEGHMLDSLQTFHLLCFCKRCVRLLERTPNLRKLGFSGPVDNSDPCFTDLEFLKCLKELFVNHARVTLKLPLTLTRLTLEYTYTEWEELSIIVQALPRLEVLNLLSKACVGGVWSTTELEEGFSQLKYLKLEYLDIREWNAFDDQFPRLEVLVIKRCKELNVIPMDFANLKELREIEIDGCSRYLEESAKEIQEKQRYTNGDDDCVQIQCRRYD